MKRFFALFAIVTMSILTLSCKDENGADLGKEVWVNYTINNDELKSRVSGDGTTANRLYWAFYEADGTLLTELSNTTGVEWNGIEGKTIPVKLLVGRTYSAFFFAQNEALPYNIDFEELTIEYVPDADLRFFSAEQTDAFYAHLTNITAENPQTTVTLTRPFGQVNIGVPTTDYEAGLEAGVNLKTLRITTLDNHLGLNVKTQQLYSYDPYNPESPTINNETWGLAWKWEPPLLEKKSFVINEVETEYTILSTYYMLLSQTQNKKTISTICFEMSELEGQEHNGTDLVRHWFYSVPVELNCRTYILGNLITTDGGTPFTVVVRPTPGGSSVEVISAQ